MEKESATKKLMNTLAVQGYSDEQISELVQTCLLLSSVKGTTFGEVVSKLMELMEKAKQGDCEDDQ